MKTDKTHKKHLPVYGVGPIYGATIILVTIVGIILSNQKMLNCGKFDKIKTWFIVTGILILAYGFSVWYRAAFKIDKYITTNKLCTMGVYAVVRNPCYSGIMLMCTGALFIANNAILLILPFAYWLLMTVLMKNTEEKWLYALYGQEYLDYCKKVNRCIPWFEKCK